MWDLPAPGIEPVSPALVDRVLTTGPPGNSEIEIFTNNLNSKFIDLSFRISFSDLPLAQIQEESEEARSASSFLAEVSQYTSG